MTHLTLEYFTFFKELANNNSSEWFNANKPRYEREVKTPFLSFLETLVVLLKETEPDLQNVEPKKMLFRINRDIRFSKDKRPYKEHLAASIGKFGTKDKMYPSHYIHIGIEEIFIAGGAYFFEQKEMLAKVRHYIFEHNTEFENHIQTPDFKKYWGVIQGEKNKRFTPELQEMIDTQPLIANTQFYWSQTFKSDEVLKDNFAERIAQHFRAAQSMNLFLAEAMY